MKETTNLKEYEAYLFQKELSEGTIDIYTRQASRLLDYLRGRDITKDEMIAYKKYLLTQYSKAATINLYIVALNSYLKYAGYEECTLKTKKQQRNRCLENVINRNEYQIMLSYAKQSGREKYYHIMRVLVFTGIRIGELQFLTVEVLALGRFTVVNKGKVREVYLPDRLVEELYRYCKSEGIESGVIFVGSKQQPISRIAVYKMFVHLADMTGIETKKAHPHSFRHLFALTYMKQYADLTELSDILGHSSLETTRIYTTTTAEEKRNKLNKLDF